ncbi:uncharacterized protein [Onthophagus taurus]|uniref:uncharacterized protein n=1 Tax=Onthophagus taurus TaxID=166361 RepID=UPI0039BDFBEE
MKTSQLKSFIGLAFIARVCWALNSLRINVPRPIKVGDTVTLTCDYDLEGEQLYAIKWYWKEAEFFRFVPRESPPFKTFAVRHIIVDVSGSDRNKVTLKDVQKVISGTYTCEVSADAPTFHTEMKGGFMQVHELPHGNLTMIIEPSKVEVGKLLKANCRSPLAYPAPNLIWSINNETVYYNTSEIETYNYIESVKILSEYSETKIQIIINQSFFDQNGHMELRCNGILDELWKSSVSKVLKDETPVFAPVLGSTSSQIDDGDQQGNFDKLMNSSSFGPSSLQRASISYIFLLLIFFTLIIR